MYREIRRITKKGKTKEIETIYYDKETDLKTGITTKRVDIKETWIKADKKDIISNLILRYAIGAAIFGAGIAWLLSNGINLK